jgi:hypothetical protein
MAVVFYTAEKAKYGIFSGAVIPFARSLTGSNPGGGDFKQYAPAGYLKCNGAIYRCKDFPVLQGIVGSGQACKFKKDNIELQEPNLDFSDGQFQVPDLGAKFVNAAQFSGGYNNLFTEDRFGNVVPVVGLAADVELNQGNDIQIFYEGSFQVGRTEVSFSNAMNFTSTLTPAVETEDIGAIAYLSHAHYSNCAVLRSGPWNSNDTQSGTSGDIFVSANTEIGAVSGTETSTRHGHAIDVSRVERTTESFIDSFAASAANVITNVRLSKEPTVKFDDLMHKFILVEYLIKF